MSRVKTALFIYISADRRTNIYERPPALSTGDPAEMKGFLSPHLKMTGKTSPGIVSEKGVISGPVLVVVGSILTVGKILSQLKCFQQSSDSPDPSSNLDHQNNIRMSYQLTQSPTHSF